MLINLRIDWKQSVPLRRSKMTRKGCNGWIKQVKLVKMKERIIYQNTMDLELAETNSL